MQAHTSGNAPSATRKSALKKREMSMGGRKKKREGRNCCTLGRAHVTASVSQRKTTWAQDKDGGIFVSLLMGGGGKGGKRDLGGEYTRHKA